MSPSNSIKSHSGDPTTYQQMQQALFKFGNDAKGSSHNNTEAVNIAEGPLSSANTTSQVSPKQNPKESDSTREATGAHAENVSKSTPNTPLLSQNQQKISSQQSSEKSNDSLAKAETSETISDRSPSVLNLADTKPIKPRPAVSGTDLELKSTSTMPVMVSAAVATSLPAPKLAERVSPKSTSTKPKATARRRGKWTVEEEEYVARVIQDFNSGFLNAPAGYTLRSYLSDKLQCDPMRITKKFTGESCIGKRVFHPAVRSAANAAAIDKAQVCLFLFFVRGVLICLDLSISDICPLLVSSLINLFVKAELDALERRWRRRLEMQQRESAKKAAASAAAANAASRATVTVQGVPVSMLGVNSQNSTDSQLQQSAVTQAATWLDRANVILMGNSPSQNYREKRTDETRSSNSSMEDSLEHQMKEVQRLIYEGPMIQQTTAGLPNLLIRTDVQTDKRHHDDNNTILAASSISSHLSPTTLEPADKRMRTVSAADSNPSGAEDAEALVGFLRSVRASAAAGQEL